MQYHLQALSQTNFYSLALNYSVTPYEVYVKLWRVRHINREGINEQLNCGYTQETSVTMDTHRSASQ